MISPLALGRWCAYASVAAAAATSPDIAKTLALVAPSKVHALASPAAGTLGWLGSEAENQIARLLGFGGLAFVTALAICGTLALVEWRARRAASPGFALCAALVSAACSLDVLHVGEGATNGLFLAALLACFDLRGARAFVATAIVTALWCNASAQGILAPVFAIAFALGATIDRAERAERTHVLGLASTCALATLATPALFSYPALAWRALGLDGAVNDLLPSAPSVVAPLSYHAGVVLTILAALAIGVRSARSGDTLVFALAAIFAFSKGALVPFVGIAAAPVLAETATRIWGATRARALDSAALLSTFAAPALVVALLVGIVGAGRFPGTATAMQTAPYGALAKYAHARPTRARILCTKLQWCDVAERAYGFDVVADSRVPSDSDTTIAAQRSIAAAKPGWIAKARALGVDAIFVDKRSGLATLLVSDGWRAYAVDGTGALFVRMAATL